MRAKLWMICLLGMLAAGAMSFLLETTSLSRLALYNGIGLSAVVAVLYGIRRNDPDNRRSWCFIAAGMALFLTADVIRYVLDVIIDTAPFPSLADAFHLAMYPLMIMGVLGILRTVSTGRDMAGLVDAGLVAVATFAVLGILIMDTYVADETMDLAGRLVSIAYPLMDVALIAVAARLVAAVHLRQTTFALMTIGLFSLLIADAIHGVLGVAGTFQPGGASDAFWIGFYAFVAAAALHPSMGQRVVPRENAMGHITRPRLVVLSLVVLEVQAYIDRTQHWRSMAVRPYLAEVAPPVRAGCAPKPQPVCWPQGAPGPAGPMSRAMC